MIKQSESADVSDRARTSWALMSIGGFVLVALTSLFSALPPAPLAADAPAQMFSAARAQAVLARVLDEGAPHPTGSAENAALRARLLSEFARIGYQAEARSRFVCSRWGTCATVHNVLANLPGTGTGPGVLATAHYDSVAAGPGAGDDGAGVAAVLEVARALKAGPSLPRDVWFLLGDGEELGLLSAEAFVQSAEFAQVGTVINLEARGTDGPSQLFETQSGNARIIALVGTALERPVASSLAYEIYKRMPNDTDFTVFRRAGLAGLNFAFTGGAARYHTPRDNLAQLSAASLQHHGDNLLTTVRALASAGSTLRAEQDRVFFDVFTRALVSWPASWNPVLLLAALLGLFTLLWRLRRARCWRPWRLLGACIVLPVLALTAMALGVGLQAALSGTAAASAGWTAQGTWLVITFLALAVLWCTAWARPLVRWLGASELACASLATFALLAVAGVLWMPGASHMALLPLLAGVLVGHAVPKRVTLWAACAALLTALLWFPLAFQLYEAMGYPGLPAASFLLTMALLPLLPAMADLRRGAAVIGSLALLVVAIGIGIVLTRPAFTHAVPRGYNLVYAATDRGGRLLGDRNPPPALASVAGFGSTPVSALPWDDRPRLEGSKGPGLAAPVVELVRTTATAKGRTLRLHVRSQRDARTVRLLLPRAAGASTIRIHGQTVPALHPHWTSGWRAVTVVAPQTAGTTIDIELTSHESMDMYVLDILDRLPPRFADIIAARDEIAVPIHAGDHSIAWRRVSLPTEPETVTVP